MILLLAASTQVSARLNNAAGDSDGFWKDHTTGQKVTFVGYILNDWEIFKKGQFKIKTIAEYSNVRLLGKTMPGALIQYVPIEVLNTFTAELPPEQVTGGGKKSYLEQAVSITVVCLKRKDVIEPVFKFDAIENFDIPGE